MQLSNEYLTLIKVIRDAFANTEHPGDTCIVRSDDHWDALAVKEWLGNRRWEDLPMDDMEGRDVDAVIWLLTPKAYRYFLPAFLLSAIQDQPGAPYQGLIDSLAPPPIGIGEKSDFIARVGMLTHHQKRAVSLFLREAARREDKWSKEGSHVIGEARQSGITSRNIPYEALRLYWDDEC